MAAKIVPLRPVRAQVSTRKATMDRMITFMGDVQTLADDLVLFRLALKGAIDEAASLLNQPPLHDLMEPVTDQIIKLHERAFALRTDAYGVTGDACRFLAERRS